VTAHQDGLDDGLAYVASGHRSDATPTSRVWGELVAQGASATQALPAQCGNLVRAGCFCRISADGIVNA